MRTPDFWEKPGPIPTMLTPLSWIWQAHSGARSLLTKPKSLGVPVICVGNTVAGGAGKTPVTTAIIKTLTALNCNAHILSRGYGGTVEKPTLVDPNKHDHTDVGDEPLLHARHAPTWVSPSRVNGGRAAIAGGASAILMDDGFQNPTIYKDFSILVVDGEYGFGNKRILPAGPLRESINSAMRRADLVVIIGPEIRKVASIIGKGKPVLTARFVPADHDVKISGARVLAFAGIGRPTKFFQTLAEMGCNLIETWSYPDHHVFTDKQISNILKIAKEKDAIPITTEKDSVRLPVSARDIVQILPVTLEWNDKQAFDDIIETTILTKA